MNNEHSIISIYFLCDELFRALKIETHSRSINSDAEIATIAIISALYYHGNHHFARLQMAHLGYISRLISPSRFNRRLHKIPNDFWKKLFSVISILNRESNSSKIYLVDSFPVPTAQICKFFRAKRFRGRDFHGRVASKKQYFMGLKVHMVTSEKGNPVSYEILPGSYSDIKGLYHIDLELPKSSILLGDKAYSSKYMEKYLSECQGVMLLPKRRKNQKKQHSLLVNSIISKIRNRIETTFSSITRLFPRSIVARTANGFLRKLHLFILSYTLNRFLNT